MWLYVMVCPRFSSAVTHRCPTERKKEEALSFLGGVGGVGAGEEGTSSLSLGRRTKGKVRVSPTSGLSPWKGNMMGIQLWDVMLIP